VNSINGQPKALRQLRKIDAHAGKQIRVAVSAELIDLSVARNVKALTNHEHRYRLRMGSYRAERVNEIATPSVMNFRKLMLGFVQMW
jgi:mRNA interferase RelE/StbE